MIGFVLHDAACTQFPQFIETTTGLPPAAPEGFIWTQCPIPAINYRATPAGDGFMAIPYQMPAAAALEAAQSAKWAAAKAYRDMRMAGICATPFGAVQIDDVSKVKINGLVTMSVVAGMTGAAFNAAFTLSDNSVVSLNGGQMITLGVAVGQFVDACQSAGTAVRNQINAAKSQDEVAAIDITAGYP